MQYGVLMFGVLVPTCATRVVVYLHPISMRWGATKVRAFCEKAIGFKPDRSTALLFTNKIQDRLLMYTVGDAGDELLMKKLDKGAFLLPAPPADGARFVTMSPKMVPRLFRT